MGEKSKCYYKTIVSLSLSLQCFTKKVKWSKRGREGEKKNGDRERERDRGDWTPSVEREKGKRGREREKESERGRESWCRRRSDCQTKSEGR